MSNETACKHCGAPGHHADEIVYGTERIEAVERRQNSASGNPRWHVTLTGGTHKTVDDAAVNYDIESHVGALVRVGYRHGEIVSVEATSTE